MLRDEYFRRLVDDAYIGLYLAGNDGARIYWPWRMARENGSLSDRHRNSCEVYWVDSSIQNSDYTNRDVLDDAARYNAEAVLLADTMGEFEQTVKSLKHGLDLADDHAFSGDIIIPLQAPYDKCYAEFAGESNYYAIGGLKNSSTDQPRIQAAKTVREIAGDSIHLHGLGWGPRDELVSAIHDDPDLLDSIDYSTPVQSNTEAMAGTERMSVTAMAAAERLVRDLRKVTPHVDFDPKPTELRESEQTGFEELV
jgi:hypothetical protein